MKRNIWIIVLVVSMLTLLTACGGGATPEPAPAADTQPDEVAPPVEESAPGEDEMSGEFPLPDDAENVIDLGDGAINFQTSLSLPDVVSFYRFDFIGAGFSEREILTVIEETTFSMVFDGHPSGKAIVIQGVNLGDSINVNIRFEDV